ncbi:MAG: hypothetical protein DRQ13_02845 [Ignavibacteriae bacterium]|nr:MAG: hypothetical protein DRQ13_02845 [Ignavibacteriota bacterium]
MNEQKKERIKNLMATLSALTDEEKEQLVAKLGIMNPEGHILSPRNQMLLYFQVGDKPLSVVAGFKQWQEAGRSVMQGERGYLIAVPATSKKENEEVNPEEEPEVYFLWRYVFDISQTKEAVTKVEEGVAA